LNYQRTIAVPAAFSCREPPAPHQGAGFLSRQPARNKNKGDKKELYINGLSPNISDDFDALVNGKLMAEHLLPWVGYIGVGGKRDVSVSFTYALGDRFDGRGCLPVVEFPYILHQLQKSGRVFPDFAFRVVLGVEIVVAVSFDRVKQVFQISVDNHVHFSGSGSSTSKRIATITE